jgi:hypothetical protein
MLIKGTVSDSATGKPIAAKIFISDKPSNDILETMHSNSETGKYLLLFNEGKGYRIEVQAEGYEPIIEDISIEEMHEFAESTKNYKMVKVAEN